MFAEEEKLPKTPKMLAEVSTAAGFKSRLLPSLPDCSGFSEVIHQGCKRIETDPSLGDPTGLRWIFNHQDCKRIGQTKTDPSLSDPAGQQCIFLR